MHTDFMRYRASHRVTRRVRPTFQQYSVCIIDLVASYLSLLAMEFAHKSIDAVCFEMPSWSKRWDRCTEPHNHAKVVISVDLGSFFRSYSICFADFVSHSATMDQHTHSIVCYTIF